MMFFTAALLLNAIRWVTLIKDVKNRTSSEFTLVHKFAIVVILGALCSVSIYRMVIECDEHPADELDNRLNLPVLLATFTI
jgi:hypothetical protein